MPSGIEPAARPQQLVNHMSNSSRAGSKLSDPTQWVDAHGDALFRYAVSRLNDPAAAEEAVRATFLDALHARAHNSTFQADRAALLELLQKRIVEAMRRRANEDRHGADSAQDDSSTELFDPSGRWRPDSLAGSLNSWNRVSRELWETVRESLARLPFALADVYVLTMMDGRSPDEVCRDLALTPDELSDRLHRVRLALAKSVGDRWLTRNGSLENVE